MNKIAQKQHTLVFKRWSRKGYGVFASLHRHTTIGVLSVAMSIISLSAHPAMAKTDDAASQKVLEDEIEEVTVTGHNSSLGRSVATQVTLFESKSEVAAPVQSLESVLRLSPSIDVRERGGRGVQADISLRGGSFDQTQIKLNGINFTDARTGHQSHALPVDLESVSAMELQEDVCGIGAYAGAINVRTAPMYPRYFRAEGCGGMFGYGNANLSGGYTYKDLTTMASASYKHSNGYKHNTDFDNVNVYARATYDNEKAGLIDFQIGYQWRQFGSNGFYAAYNPDQWEKTQTILTSLKYGKAFGDFSFNVSGSYRKNYDRYDWTRGTPMNLHETDNVGAELELHYNSVAGITTLGGDYTYNHIYSTNLGLPLEAPVGDYKKADARHVGNLWLQHSKVWSMASVSGSVGVAFTPYGIRPLWNVSASYQPVKILNLEIGASQSMRLPTFTDLYYTSPAQVNNLDLVPEEAITCRFKATVGQKEWSASAGVYYRWGQNVIDWVWHDEGEYAGKWHSEQTSKLGTLGVEVTGAYHPEKGIIQRIAFTYGYINTTQGTDLVTQNAMDFMRNKAALSVILRLPVGFYLSANASVYDRAGSYNYYPEEGNSSLYEVRDFKPYFLLDMRLSWERKWFECYVDVSNVTNTEYCDMSGLTLPGIWATGGVVFTLGKQ